MTNRLDDGGDGSDGGDGDCFLFLQQSFSYNKTQIFFPPIRFT